VPAMVVPEPPMFYCEIIPPKNTGTEKNPDL
jgi:hypothetical protein